MSKLRHARLIGARSAALSLAVLLAACGGQPEPANNAAATTDNASNEAASAAENAAANIAAPANAVNSAAPAAAASPTPTPTPTPSASATPEAKPVAAASGGDAANGAKLFAQCKICHAVEPGKNGLGPSLHGVVGRKAATLAGFSYSPAMKASGLTWSDAELNDYLRAPMKAVPGTKMAFAGIANDKNRADVIAYLDTLK
ncbi:MAG: cytochrome c family protein [Sphingomonadales bacterium]|nr:cytochrome c family protein [Sphingomonadales bacterium]